MTTLDIATGWLVCFGLGAALDAHCWWRHGKRLRRRHPRLPYRHPMSDYPWWHLFVFLLAAPSFLVSITLYYIIHLDDYWGN
jgi:hypothetical protein